MSFRYTSRYSGNSMVTLPPSKFFDVHDQKGGGVRKRGTRLKTVSQLSHTRTAG